MIAFKGLLSVVALVAVVAFLPIALFFAVFDAVKLCAWILRDIMVNLWSGGWR